MISWMKYDPTIEVNKLDIPVLVVQGTTDIQVAIEDAKLLGESNPKAKLVIVEGMNHIFKDVEMDKVKNIATYSNPDLPINEVFLKEIVSFILEQNKYLLVNFCVQEDVFILLFIYKINCMTGHDTSGFCS